jgi:predicted PolB exonuclease-like 3'-5' exonuclease
LNSFPELPTNGDCAEGEIIERFLTALGKYRPQLVGFNSLESDVQVLIQRAMINELTAPEFCQRPNKPWEGDDYFDAKNSEGHIDILKRFVGGAMQPKLDEFARLCGYPGKIDVKGDQVTDLWLNRDLTRIVEYNQTDALNTYLLWLRLVHFCGKLESEKYFAEMESFREFLETEVQKPEKAFVGDFLAKWPL